MATLTEIRNKADARLADLWTSLQAKQDAYFAKNGEYFQLLVTPESPVVNGLDSDFIKRSPSDEKNIADVDFVYSAKIPFNLRVDVWDGPQGKGYTARVEVQLQNGNQYYRERDSNNVDSGWNPLTKL